MTIRELIAALEALPDEQKDFIAAVRGYPDCDGNCDWTRIEELHPSEVVLEELVPCPHGDENCPGHWQRRVAPAVWLYA